MTLLQAFLLGIFGWLGHTHTPFFGGGLLGWYTLGRPLVSGLVIGLILGDVQGAIILACAVQALYIGLVTPGGSISPDMNLATWIAVPLGLLAGAGAGITVAMAAPIGILATILSQPCHACMIAVAHHQANLVEKGKLRQATLVPIYGHSVKFLFRFLPIFLCCYFGQDFLSNVVNNSPAWLVDILTIFGRPMPLVGFAILLKMMVKDKFEFVYYLLGFALIAVFGVNIITVVIFAAVFAYVDFKMAKYAKGADA
ncbi:PTS mannose/fructose/sorbose/N-acetylgalactosamine transporter subunit IIC [Anaeropeptidivorans aminofermentans]|jgi:PTS system mannose-specific IIC component|uniref:PTS mannose/fructose/sorbose/N-acetylgalactosamine transporter subunit IIC n=1 Tax=Anaeropeptidivorans aminofermentans TaxID=2934315 RepID=UPI0020248001|nr:PTS sugar transporter subunit IIC [Anaeropeptidivorans aminofermentans]MBE6013686.1 PTS sugar transporter subunit IIC [Lachnospiraceae bacterium]